MLQAWHHSYSSSQCHLLLRSLLLLKCQWGGRMARTYRPWGDFLISSRSQCLDAMGRTAILQLLAQRQCPWSANFNMGRNRSLISHPAAPSPDAALRDWTWWVVAQSWLRHFSSGITAGPCCVTWDVYSGEWKTRGKVTSSKWLPQHTDYHWWWHPLLGWHELLNIFHHLCFWDCRLPRGLFLSSPFEISTIFTFLL